MISKGLYSSVGRAGVLCAKDLQRTLVRLWINWETFTQWRPSQQPYNASVTFQFIIQLCTQSHSSLSTWICPADVSISAAIISLSSSTKLSDSVETITCPQRKPLNGIYSLSGCGRASVKEMCFLSSCLFPTLCVPQEDLLDRSDLILVSQMPGLGWDHTNKYLQ